MPLFSKNSQSKEAKKRYERLLVIAKDNPDRIFDFNSCELSNVPEALYSQCKVFLTESLILHTNYLKSIGSGRLISNLTSLKVLDIHNNRLKNLPKEIGELHCLQNLNVSNNLLTELPQTIGKLVNLKLLFAKDNKINSLPSSINTMHSLQTLDISGTNCVKYLNKNICYARNLQVLLLSNTNQMEYPASWICEEGLESIQKFICRDLGVEYIPPSHAVLGLPSSPTNKEPAKLGSEFNQEEKRLRQIEFEKRLQEEQHFQAKIAQKQLLDKEKNAKLLEQDIKQFEKSIVYQHEKGEKERKMLLDQLNKVEKDASSVVQKLLDESKRAKKQEELMEKLERDKIEQENYFKVTQQDIDTLRKKETMAAMKTMIAENEQYQHLVTTYLQHQSDSQKRAFATMANDDFIIQQEMTRKEELQSNLVQQVLTEEKFQREAFIQLQMEQDVVQIRINDQIRVLQSELIKLTQIETERNKYKSNQNQQSLTKVRNELSDLLIVLLKEKDNRELELRDRLVQIEEQKDNDNIDFWLIQYQKLLDSKPEKLIEREDSLEIEIIKLLARSDASKYASQFARHHVSSANVKSLDEKQLRQIGVHETGTVQNILREIENFVAHNKKVDLKTTEYKKVEDSKPPDIAEVSTPEQVITPDKPGTSEGETPSAPSPPPLLTEDNECTICMDAVRNVVFLPCGHVCACVKCSSQISSCPICRAKIEKKVRIFTT